MPQVEVTFDIDANGIVNVSAKDMGTGREQKITITASSGLSKEEIDRMTKDADAHAGEDQKKREEIESRNRLDGLTYQVEKTFNENREKLGEMRVLWKPQSPTRRRRLKRADRPHEQRLQRAPDRFAQTRRSDLPASRNRQLSRRRGRGASISGGRSSRRRRRNRQHNERRRQRD
jgi:molecular chaperone DnaK (HSP70)